MNPTQKQFSLNRGASRKQISISLKTNAMKTLVLLAAALLLALPLSAQTDKATTTAITQTKPNYFGETKTTFKDANGKTVGEGITQTKPDYFGETKTIIKDANGKTVGEGITQTKPNYFGETKTVIKGAAPFNSSSKSKR